MVDPDWTEPDPGGASDDAPLLAHEAQQNPSLWRRIAILQVLAQRGFTPWRVLIAAVERALEPGIFGEKPHSCLWRDVRVLRDSGMAIGHSRLPGAEGYYLRGAALGEPAAGGIAAAFEGMDRLAAEAFAVVLADDGVAPEHVLIDLLERSENGAHHEHVQRAAALVLARRETLDLGAITGLAAEAGLGGLWAGLLDAAWRFEPR